MSTRLTAAERRTLPAVIDLATAARTVGMGRTKAYELAQTGEFPCTVLRVGNRYRILTAEVLRLLRINDPTDDGQQQRSA